MRKGNIRSRGLSQADTHKMAGISLAEVGIASHAAVAAAYVLLAFVVFRQWNRTLSGLIAAAAALATALWASAVTYELYAEAAIMAPARFLEILRTVGWLGLALSLLSWQGSHQVRFRRTLLLGSCVAIAAATAAVIAAAAELAGRFDPKLLQQIIFSGNLLLALIGLALVENILRNASRAQNWSVRYFGIGAGGLFAYDFYLYSDALLFHHLSPDLFIARGAADLLVAPLLAVFVMRNRQKGPQIAVSKRFVFHSATIVAAGLYLMVMAAAGYYVRSIGGSWSTFLQTIFFFGALVLLLVPISSSSVRGYLRVAIEKSFFQYKYDYREEWLRFIRTISSGGPDQRLGERVIEAVCTIVDSPEGGLWLRRDGDSFVLAGSWNLSRWNIAASGGPIPATSALARFLDRTQWIVSLDEFAAYTYRYEGLAELPDWLQPIGRAWLIVPLMHHDRLFGVMILGRPRSARDLNWEDYDILKTVGRQAASYLAQEETSEALAEARQFEAFNKRFAFVVHDIKNLVSQLSLILSNAAKHRANKEFQDDMIETVRQSVEKMNRMLKQLHAEPSWSEPKSPVELTALLRKVVDSQSQLGSSVDLDLQVERLSVVADEDRLKAVVEHLLQNAIEAVGADGSVRVRLSGEGRMAVLEVEDNGPGMDTEFVRQKLFRPFATTKGTGYGIGAYESREFARALGGQLDVTSEPGRGTVMRIKLPAAASG